MSAVQELDAKEVQNTMSLQGVDQSATRPYHFHVHIYERYGRAFIFWSLDPHYAIGPNDVVQLREGSTWIANSAVSEPSGIWDTGRTFGTGLNASYWAMDQPTKKWRQLVATENT